MSEHFLSVGPHAKYVCTSKGARSGPALIGCGRLCVKIEEIPQTDESPCGVHGVMLGQSSTARLVVTEGRLARALDENRGLVDADYRTASLPHCFWALPQGMSGKAAHSDLRWHGE